MKKKNKREYVKRRTESKGGKGEILLLYPRYTETDRLTQVDKDK